MKWFKHDTDAHVDAKLDKVLMHYGSHGYAVYFYCLELIAGKLDAQNTSCALEHDAEQIGARLKIDSVEVTGILQYIVDIGLFEREIEGAVTCLKLLGRLDKSMTNSPQLRKLIGEGRQKTSANVMTCHDMSGDVTPEEKRREEKRIKPLSDKSDDFPFSEFWNLYDRKDDKQGALKVWTKLSAEDQRAAFERVASNKFQEWRRKQRRGEDDFAPQVRKWLHNRRWEDQSLFSQPDADRNVWEVKPCRP